MLSVLAGTASQALAGTPIDSTFGPDGTVVPVLEQAWESSGFSEVVAQPDGGVIVRFGSAAVNSLVTDSMHRYRGDGSIDPSYVSPVSPSGGVRATQGDGKALIAESLPNGPGGLIVRQGSDGSLDQTFGVEGRSASVPFGISAISQGPTGAILVAGSIDRSYMGMHGAPSVSLVEPFVARFLPDGRLDPSFASGGIVNLRDAGKIEGFPREVNEAVDGKVWLSMRSASGRGGTLARLTPGGALDASFGSDGTVDAGGEIVGFHPVPAGGAMVIVNRKGKRLGRFATAESVHLLLYQADGRGESRFDSRDAAAIDLDGILQATAVTWRGDGSSLVAVSRAVPGAACRNFYDACTATPVMLRFASGGRPDPGFGSSGTVRLDSMAGPSSFSRVNSLVARAGGGYFAAGTSGLQAFLIGVREDGSLDSGFGDGGIVRDSVRRPSSNFAGHIAVDPAGRILVAGKGDAGVMTGGPPAGILVRLDPEGALDRSFANGHGSLDVPGEVNALDVDRRSRPLVLIDRTAVARITSSGRIDLSFGKEGFVFPGSGSELTSIAALPNGAMLVGGTVGGVPTVFRLGTKGRIDRSFGKRGKAVLAFGARGDCTVRDLTVQRDRRVLIAGKCLRMRSAYRETMVVGRLLPNGNPDRSFGRFGRLPVAFGRRWSAVTAIAVQGGRILVTVRLTEGERQRQLLLRLGRDGRRDSSFASKGLAQIRIPAPVDPSACASYDEAWSILPTGDRIILVRDGVGPSVLAFRRDGRRDWSFFGDGRVTPGRQVATGCLPELFGALHHGRVVIAWSGGFGDGPPPWSIALHRFDTG